jgi:acyl-CoA thioesterase
VSTTDQSQLTESEFDRGIALHERAEQPSVYNGELDAGWKVGAGINGGLLLAVAANALKQVFLGDGHLDPIAISAYYLSASRSGPSTLHTDVIRRGRTMSTGQVSLTQAEDDGGSVERVRAIATYGNLDDLPDEVHTTATPPVMPPPDQCIGTDLAPADFRATAALLDRFDLRLDPDCVGWALGEPSKRGVIQGWLKLADGREPDPLMLLLAVDALPPVTFDLGLPGWAPTVELTAHLRAKPAPGWLRVVHSTRNFAGGFLEEDAEVWDSTGRLVAQSRQLARAPRPR